MTQLHVTAVGPGRASRSGASVTSIARACGYRAVAGFSRDFRRQFGVAPSVVLRESSGCGPLG